MKPNRPSGRQIMHIRDSVSEGAFDSHPCAFICLSKNRKTAALKERP